MQVKENGSYVRKTLRVLETYTAADRGGERGKGARSSSAVERGCAGVTALPLHVASTREHRHGGADGVPRFADWNNLVLRPIIL